MSIKLLTKYSLKIALTVVLFILSGTTVRSQDTITDNVPDSLLFHTNTLAVDTSAKNTKIIGIKSKIDCSATDSIRFNISEHKVYLFNESSIDYEKINLKANYIDIDFMNKKIYSYKRYDDNYELIIICNFVDKSYKFDITKYKEYKLLLTNYKDNYDDFLKPYEARVYIKKYK